MALFLISLFAGFLTVLAPCTLPLLPIIIGRSIQEDKKNRNAFIITGSLTLSVVAFTLLLKATTALIVIPPWVWSLFAGAIISSFGLASLFPTLWSKIASSIGFKKSSDKWMNSAHAKQGRLGDILLGASFGPVFASCSPTYFIILATVLPQSFTVGVIYLFAYAVGLSTALLLAALLGRAFISKVQFAADPNGWFKKIIGLFFLLIGISILFGWDKDFEAYLIDQGYSGIIGIEEQLLENIDPQ